jgi:hypothetical protein
VPPHPCSLYGFSCPISLGLFFSQHAAGDSMLTAVTFRIYDVNEDGFIDESDLYTVRSAMASIAFIS